MTAERPLELQSHWDVEYPEVDVASVKIAILERYGYCPEAEAYFYLPPNCWLENYYRPLQSSYDPFLDRNRHIAQAKEIVECEKVEIALYEKFSDYYSTVFI